MQDYQITILDFLYQLFHEISDMKMSYLYLSSSGEIKKYEINNSQKQVFVVDNDDDLTYYVDIRTKRKQNFVWELAEDYQHSFAKKQLKIENENDNYLLLLRFDSDSDENQDIIFITFRKNLSFLSLNSSHLILSPDNKTMLATLLFRFISTKIAEINKSNAEIVEISDNFENIFLQKTKENETLNSQFTNLIVDIINRYVEEYKAKNNINKKIVFDFSAVTKIINSNLSFADIELSLSETLKIFGRLKFDKSEIIIDSDHLLIRREKEIEEKSIKSEPLNKDNRVSNYLDTIEIIISKLINAGERITGATVGSYFTPRVSAAAISEYVSKHVDEIIEIISSNPEKYNLIQKYFKPVTNKMPRYSMLGRK